MISGKEGVGGWKKKRISSEGGGESWEGEKKRWGSVISSQQKIFFECQLSELFKSASSVTARTTQFKLLGKQEIETPYAIYIQDGVTP